MKNYLCYIAIVVMLCAPAVAEITGDLTAVGYGSNISETHLPGEMKTYTLDFNIEISGEAGGLADVLFLTDTTGSMGSYINATKTAISGILAEISTSLPELDIQYAVADYRNYTDGGNYSAYGVNLRQPFTADTALVQAAINSMSASGGADTPESQLKGMVSIATNWLTPTGDLGFGGRATAQKIVCWAGDAPGHIAGDEPGSSGSPPPGYYPTLAGTIDALNAQGILVFGLNVYGSGSGINALYGGAHQQDAITSATGGISFYSVGTGGPDINDAIVGAITGGVETLTNITMSMDGSSGSFVIDPTSQTMIGAWTADDSPVEGSFSFDATAPLPEGTEVNFDMVLLGNGAELDRVPVTLKVWSNTPPDTDDAYPSFDCLRLPFHQFIPIQILGVTDPDGDDVTIMITEITSDEPTATAPGAGGPEHAPDAYGVGTDIAYLRSERSALGDGRVYVINFVAIDEMGEGTEGSVSVVVPKVPRRCNTAVDSGQLYDATVEN